MYLVLKRFYGVESFHSNHFDLDIFQSKNVVLQPYLIINRYLTVSLFTVHTGNFSWNVFFLKIFLL